MSLLTQELQGAPHSYELIQYLSVACLTNKAPSKGIKFVKCGATAGKLAAYSQLLIVPLMARMSDPLPAVRRTAAPTFAALVALVPLAQVCSALHRMRSMILHPSGSIPLHLALHWCSLH